MNYFRRILLALAIATSSIACGQIAASTANDDDLPIVLSASRLKQSALQAPAPVTVIDRETILAMGVRQIVDVLRLVPGVTVQYARGYWATLGMRGYGEFYGRNLQVLIDGVSVYSPMTSGVDWTALPISPHDIERIEIIRGPNASTFGANAFFGVVNIITRDPATEPQFQITSTSGDRGVLDGNVRFSKQGEAWRWRASVGRRSDSGFQERPDNHRFGFASLRGDAQLSAQDSLLVNLRAGDRDAEDGIGATKRTASEQSAAVQVRWTRATGLDDEWWVQYYELNTSALDHTTFSQDYDTRRRGIEVQQTKRLSGYLRASWGGEWRQDQVRSALYFGTSRWIKSELSRAFASAEWEIANDWVLQPSSMLESNDMSGRSASSRLALSWQPIHNHVFRIGTAKARLSPPMLQEYFNLPGVYVSSGQVADASIRSDELAYAFEVPSWHLSGDVRWFQERVSGLVVPIKKDFINQHDTSNRGGDVSLIWKPFFGTYLRLATARTVVETNVDPRDRTYAASAPKHTATLHWRQALPGDMEFSATHSRVGSTTWLEPRRDIPAYSKLDVRIAKKIRFGKERGEIALVTQNMDGSELDFYEVKAVKTYQRRATFVQLSLEY